MSKPEKMNGYKIKTPNGSIGWSGRTETFSAMSEGVARQTIKDEAKRTGQNESDFSLLLVVPILSSHQWIRLLSGIVIKQDL